MEGVVKLVPVPNEEPPVDAAYQLMVPADALAPRVNALGPQFELGVVPVIVGIVFIVKSAPLSVPIIGGKSLTTRILYPVPSEAPDGIVADIVPV